VRQVGPVVRLSQSLYREFRQTDSASTFAIEGLTLEIVGALLRADATSESGVPRWLARVREQLEDEPSRHLTVQAIAVDAGVSPVRLSRAFRRTYGESLGAYQRRVRIRHACERLRSPEATLAEIALDAGFTDQSHFSRVFTRLVGVTPGVFRREQGRSATS
jgi:AraC family transcriptional regulator